MDIRARYTDSRLHDRLSIYDNIVFWGLKNSHISHKFIFKSYCEVLDRLGVSYHWVDDEAPDRGCGANDLVFIYGGARNLDRAIADDPYIIDFHVLNAPSTNEAISEDVRERIINSPKRMSDIEHHAVTAEDGERLDALSHFCPKRRLLAQPWGTDLHPDNFMPAARNFCSTDVVFNGSVWKSRWGNLEEIIALRDACEDHGLDLHELNNAKGLQNTYLIWGSRFAPTIAGRGQAAAGYLACRFFKNISYGQYCFSNVPLARELLENHVVMADSDLGGAVGKILALHPDAWSEGIAHQQQIVGHYTIYHHLFVSLFLLQEGF